MVIAKIRDFLTRDSAGSGVPARGAIVRSRKTGPAVRLSWVWTTSSFPDVNLGDALSAVVVSAMSGLAIRRATFGNKHERLAAVGTIGHAQYGARIHFWGTGFDINRDFTGAPNGYVLPPKTSLIVHAMRGRRTAAFLRGIGLDVPDVYGDPVWFLPKIFPVDAPKTHELGVIVHISELDMPNAEGRVRGQLVRYGIPETFASSIRIINTYAPASMAGMRAKVEEIVSCRRILSTSLHGLVIAETYGIPCAWFSGHDNPSGHLPISNPQEIDHRMIDFYSGAGRSSVLAYCQQTAIATDWDAAMRFIDDQWAPLDFNGKDLFDAFPLPVAVDFDAERWTLQKDILDSNPY